MAEYNSSIPSIFDFIFCVIILQIGNSYKQTAAP